MGDDVKVPAAKRRRRGEEEIVQPILQGEGGGVVLQYGFI